MVSFSFRINVAAKISHVPSLFVLGNGPSSSPTYTSRKGLWYFWQGYPIDHTNGHEGANSKSYVQRPALYYAYPIPKQAFMAQYIVKRKGIDYEFNLSTWISYSLISANQEINFVETKACNTLYVECDGSYVPSLAWKNTSSKLYKGIWSSSAGSSFTSSSYFVFTGHARNNVNAIFIDSDYSYVTQQRPAL